MKELEDILDQCSCLDLEDINPYFTTKEALEIAKRAYTLGRNNTADWIADHCIMKEFDECGVHLTTHKEAILRAKTTEDLNLKL